MNYTNICSKLVNPLYIEFESVGDTIRPSILICNVPSAVLSGNKLLTVVLVVTEDLADDLHKSCSRTDSY